MENQTVGVKIGQAVGLQCGYLGNPVPAPEVTWLIDQVPITIDTTAVNPRYRMLEKGELVIYGLTDADISDTNTGKPLEYRCRVDNVRMAENETAPFFYALNSELRLGR